MTKRKLQRGSGQRHRVPGTNRLDPLHLGHDFRRRVGVTVARTRHRAGGKNARRERCANDEPHPALRRTRGNSLSRTSVSSNV